MLTALKHVARLAAIGALALYSAASFAQGKDAGIASVPQDYMRIMRVCNYDIGRFTDALAQPVPAKLANARTNAARHNQFVLTAKVREICESVPYWQDKMTEAAKGVEPALDDLTLAAQLVYTLELQMRYLKKAHVVFLRVLREEDERLGRIEQLEEIFTIRARMQYAKGEEKNDVAANDATTETVPSYIVR
ncbi:MAG: hypothetical protein ABW189_03180 [Rickettsiales bacterium]